MIKTADEPVNVWIWNDWQLRRRVELWGIKKSRAAALVSTPFPRLKDEMKLNWMVWYLVRPDDLLKQYHPSWALHSSDPGLTFLTARPLENVWFLSSPLKSTEPAVFKSRLIVYSSFFFFFFYSKWKLFISEQILSSQKMIFSDAACHLKSAARLAAYEVHLLLIVGYGTGFGWVLNLITSVFLTNCHSFSCLLQSLICVKQINRELND